MKKDIQTKVLKPSKTLMPSNKFGLLLIIENWKKGVVTNLILDANVVINMDELVSRGNKPSLLKEYDLLKLVKILRRSPPGSIGISPALAFREMPESAAKKALTRYHEFFAVHLPEYFDDPESLKYNEKETIERQGYFELSEIGQLFYAIPFCSLLCLLYIEKTSNLKPIDKYRSYLDIVSESLDVVSASEAFIAMYCCSPSKHDMPETEKIRSLIRKNFLRGKKDKPPRDRDSLLKIAFNGACDISLINFANAADNHIKENQESWVVTQDKKLAEFCEIFHHISLGGVEGMLAMSYLNPEQEKSEYWIRAIEMLEALLTERATTYFSKKNDFQDLSKRVGEIFEFTSSEFDSSTHKLSEKET